MLRKILATSLFALTVVGSAAAQSTSGVAVIHATPNLQSGSSTINPGTVDLNSTGTINNNGAVNLNSSGSTIHPGGRNPASRPLADCNLDASGNTSSMTGSAGANCPQ